MISAKDTIFALSSGAGKAGVAVVRVSGAGSAAAVRELTGALPEPRRACLRSIRGRNDEPIDRGLVLWLPGPGSFTGEDTAEFQVHGGRAVVSGLIDALAGLEGFRAAEAGEFARRAFDNGKLDLTEIEGLADLIDADTILQRRQALRQLDGHSGRAFEDWRQRLVGAIALCEAGIDFVDEDDVTEQVGADVVPIVERLRGEMAAHLDQQAQGEAIRDGLRVVIAGPTNAGKSSLINLLARRDVAIVSDLPGTTRDAIEVRLDLAGVPVTVVDTAGIRATDDEIELEGVRRTQMHMSGADLVLWLRELGADEAAGTDERADGEVEVWRIGTKSDLMRSAETDPAVCRFAISSKSGAGVDALIGALSDWAGGRVGSETSPIITRVRHRRGLAEAVAALERAARLDYLNEPDLVAEELRGAAASLARITGRIDVEEVLDAIFRDFCIGK